MPVINKHHHDNKVPTGSIDIMRGTIYGNPYVINFHGYRDEVIKMYKTWLWDRIQKEPLFAKKVRSLNGKTLCCCCAPLACHGDVLLAAAKYLTEKEQK